MLKVLRPLKAHAWRPSACHGLQPSEASFNSILTFHEIPPDAKWHLVAPLGASLPQHSSQQPKNGLCSFLILIIGGIGAPLGGNRANPGKHPRGNKRGYMGAPGLGRWGEVTEWADSVGARASLRRAGAGSVQLGGRKRAASLRCTNVYLNNVKM